MITCLENQFLVFFLSGCLRQVLLYIDIYQHHSRLKCRSNSQCLKSKLKTITMQVLTLKAITTAVKGTLLHNFKSRSLVCEMLVNDTWSHCVLSKYAENNYYAWFDTQVSLLHRKALLYKFVGLGTATPQTQV